MRASRAKPRIWDTDWLLLRTLSRLLRSEVSNYVKPGTVMVDIGCGDMPYADMMRDLNIDYHGADIDDSASLRIDSRGQVPLPEASAGAVLSVQVLEHVRNLDDYCGEISRLLNDDGVLLLSTHGTWLYHPHPEDYRRWTRTGLVVDLSDRGFLVEEVHGLVGPLATTTIIRLTGMAFMLRRIPILGSSLTALLSVVMNVRAVIEDKVTPRHIREDNACVFFVRARKVAA